MGDNNLNNIAKIFFSNVHNHIEEKKTSNSSKIEQIFYIKKTFFFKI
jgi:hypothetical protein